LEFSEVKEMVIAVVLTMSGIFVVAFGFVLLPLFWPSTVSAAASGATVAYNSAPWQPLGGTSQFIDSLTGAPARPVLYAFRFMFAVIGLALFIPGLLISSRVRD
jgi:hypothetical protein